METLNRLPWAAKSDVFKKLESITDVGSMSRAERLKYDEALKKYRDTISVFEGVRMEGRMEGRMQNMIENARKMKAYGFALDMIADITGLSIDEVKALEQAQLTGRQDRNIPSNGTIMNFGRQTLN